MKMKSLVLLVLVFVMSSCEPDGSFRFFPRATVVNIQAPDQLILDQENSIPVTFELPTECHSFEQFQVSGSGNDITVETVLRYEGSGPCDETPDMLSTESFTLFVENENIYKIRFIVGLTPDGQFIYETYEIPVVTE